MPKKMLDNLVKIYKGWWEGDTVRFPTPYQKELFLKAVAAYKTYSTER
jgi:hypothetical protein